jgi:hypothetical protein
MTEEFPQWADVELGQPVQVVIDNFVMFGCMCHAHLQHFINGKPTNLIVAPLP